MFLFGEIAEFASEQRPRIVRTRFRGLLLRVFFRWTWLDPLSGLKYKENRFIYLIFFLKDGLPGPCGQSIQDTMDIPRSWMESECPQ